MRHDQTTDLLQSQPPEGVDLRALLRTAREALRGGHLSAARSTLESLEDSAQRVGNVALIIEGASVAAVVEAKAGQMEVAWQHVKRAEDLTEQHQDTRGVALVHLTRATLFELLGDADAFEREARAARRAAEISSELILIARADMMLAVVASVRGDMSAALLRYGSAMANFTAVGDDFFAAIVRCNIGSLHLEMSDFHAALEQYVPAVEILSHVEGPLYLALSGLAEVLAKLGRSGEALEVSDRALASALDFDRRALAMAHMSRGVVLAAAGDRDGAFSHCTVAEALANTVDPFVGGGAALEIASIHATSGRVGEALCAIERAAHQFDALGAKSGMSRVLQRMDGVRQAARGTVLARVREAEASLALPRRHAERVAAHAIELAEHLALPELDRRWLELGALLHDVGYGILPPELFATDTLSDGHRIVLQLHCELGDDTLRQDGYPRAIREIVRHHHERWDGAGYPDHLRGESIPQLARITAIAERYAALRSPRGSRSDLTRTEALAHLAADAGHAFDPALASAFVSMMEHRADASQVHQSDASGAGAEQGLSTGDASNRIQASLGISYVLGAEIRGGGMSRLFRARDPLLEREVVVKVFPPEKGENAARRFRREMSIAANLTHPRILPILHAGLAESLPYFVMPYVSGGSVREQLHTGAIEIPLAMSILRDVADALGYAHSRGVVHRDIKPGNVLLQDGRAMLGDFGIARNARGPDLLSLTETGESVGTVGYMAPEQLLGEGDPAPPMDVYSFGVLAYEMLTGSPPFSAPTVHALMFAHITKDPAPLASVTRDIPVHVADLIDAALRKSPSERPVDGAALLRALA